MQAANAIQALSHHLQANIELNSIIYLLKTEEKNISLKS